ncbi:inositol monophosphatase family protein [Allorhodopirellula solitaria]|uniref:Inositol-1-monophosphatase n=1 Tax=Allorhodopirellula solitaria TaxID=2527987 RepID=A0A5C5YIN3_9BACT|nr:inositol monophosphatase family protein [Allorhodopirellula solitaria]TWT74719.1 Inositol-1-monophosphatase [Allorhodopirellula solitaria]
MTEFQDEMKTAAEAARVGGECLRQYFHRGVEIRDKSVTGGKSYDLVSDADIESERLIAEVLHTAFPAHAILGEESLQQGDADADHLWIIDPLDGTNNFAHRIEHFAVSVGYYEHGRAVVGAVYQPLHDDLYTAVRGQGAFRNGQRVHASTTDRLGQAMIGCGFYYDRGAMMRSTLAAIDECFSHDIHGIRRFGTASLDLCMVGCGQLDAFFEYNLSAWDFAAAALFVEEAGGQVTDACGNELPIGSTSVVASNGRLHEQVVGITTRHLPDPHPT